MVKIKNPRAIYFKSLTLGNIKCFNEIQTLNLCDEKGRPKQWTLVLGDNGIGKTTLLQCLAWMIPVPRLDKMAEHIEGIDPCLNDAQNIDFEKLFRVQQEGDSVINAKFSQGTCLTDFAKGVKETKEIYTQLTFSCKPNGALKSSDPDGSTGTHERLKKEKLLLVVYGANRNQGVANLEKKSEFEFLAQVLVENTELLDVEALLTNLDYAAAKHQEGSEHKRLSKIKSILADILPDLEGEDPIKIYGPKIAGSDLPYGIKFATRYGEVPISALSQGYRSTMGWTVDLAWKLFLEYPDSEDPLLEPAVVLIDEVDLHLHPVWQRKIINDLSNHFPNTQFVATAHSPLIVQSAMEANLAVVIKEEDHVRIENAPDFFKSWRVDQILTSELFGMPSARNPDIEKKFTERLKLLNLSKRNTKQEKRLRELDDEILTLPVLEGVQDDDVMDFLNSASKSLG